MQRGTSVAKLGTFSGRACPLRLQQPPARRASPPAKRGRTFRIGPMLALLGLLLCTCQSGCVERRMTVRSNPPGALLYVDDYPVGETPISTNFTYYGTRKIRLVKDGYETLTVMQSIPTPWYEYVPLDFVAENFVPGQIRDQHCLDFQLKPQMVVPPEQLLSRAEELRRGVHATAGISAVPGPVGNPPSGAEVIPAPQGVGGQPVRPLPPRQ
jgi:hypothetical protein